MGSKLTDISKILDQAKDDAAGKSEKGGFYSPEGDCVFFYNEDVPYTRERVDDLLTVYRADDDRRIVGLQIKAVKKLPKHDRMKVTVARKVDGSKTVDLVYLLLQTFKKATPMPDSSSGGTYAEAINTFSGAPIEVDGLELVGSPS